MMNTFDTNKQIEGKKKFHDGSIDLLIVNIIEENHAMIINTMNNEFISSNTTN